jgi:hypothetical protein
MVTFRLFLSKQNPFVHFKGNFFVVAVVQNFTQKNKHGKPQMKEL